MSDSFIIANRTDVGKRREVNEDSMVTFDSPNGRVIAVCDGMGGQAAGDVASRLACNIITDILTNNTFSTPTEAITRACMAANQGIVHRAAQNPDLEGMGATCVMVIIKDGLVYYGWIGDSRIYYINNGTISQLSHDQSYVQQLVDTGQITSAEAESHPQKNEILNALGLPNMTPPELCTSPLSPAPGSVILLCSDGLSGMVDNQTIASIVSDPELSLQRKADKLVDRANANGGVDNITVQLVQFGKQAGAPGVNAPKGAGKPIQKVNFMLWGSVAAAIIIAIVALCIIFGGEKKEDKKVNITTEQTPTKKSNDSYESPSKGNYSPSKSSSNAPKTTAPKNNGGKKGNSLQNQIDDKFNKNKNKPDNSNKNKTDNKPKSDGVTNPGSNSNNSNNSNNNSDGGSSTDDFKKLK